MIIHIAFSTNYRNKYVRENDDSRTLELASVILNEA